MVQSQINTDDINNNHNNNNHNNINNNIKPTERPKNLEGLYTRTYCRVCFLQIDTK